MNCHMVVTSEALGVWQTGLAAYGHKCLIKQASLYPI